uniref:Transmembrane protein 188 n=1 Tax=Anopheles atroparvus TaxID=41427 RepID=A0A182JD72_ANOAO
MSPSETSACEDLKAFERRLTEVIACLQPPTLRWRLILFVFGIHKLVIAPQIITSRTRNVLAEYNMSCDETGKLIVRPRPTNNPRYMDMS